MWGYNKWLFKMLRNEDRSLFFKKKIKAFQCYVNWHNSKYLQSYAFSTEILAKAYYVGQFYFSGLGEFEWRFGSYVITKQESIVNIISVFTYL